MLASSPALNCASLAGLLRREREAAEHESVSKAEAAAREQAAHATEAEAEGHHEAGHVGGLPERETVAPQQVPRR